MIAAFKISYKKIVASTILQTEQLREENLQNKQGTFAISLVLCFCLIGSYYGGNNYYFYEAANIFSFRDILNASMPNTIKFYELLWWLIIYGFFYVVIPILFIKFYLKKPLSQFGLKRSGMFSNYKIYVLLLLIVLPFVFFASFSESFQDRYPMYTMDSASDLNKHFLLWEIAYVLQFFAVEFFFRGFILHGTKHSLGVQSIILSTVPYCMIHFQKPMPEAIAAIFAGFVLSILSLKNNSIWLGVCIHACIALAMDCFSLWQRGIIF
jgi:uncharacterized protein